MPGSGNVRVITFAPPGGSLDLIARVVAQGLPEFIGKNAIVENKVGAGGNLGVTELAHAAPDGSTIGIISNGTNGINPALYGSKLSFDPINDFAPISMLVHLKLVLVTSPTLPAKTIPELVAYAKANPGKVMFGSTGVGSAAHLSGELFNLAAGIKMAHVPYNGSAKALSALSTNEIQALFPPIAESKAMIGDGRVRAIAVTSKERAEALPDLPTIAEQGYPSYDVTAWLAIAAPKRTPKETIDRYNAAIAKILSKPEVKERLGNLGMEIRTSTPAELAATMKQELAKWPPVVQASGAQIN